MQASRMERGTVTPVQYLTASQTGTSAEKFTQTGSKYALPAVGRRV